MLWHSALCGIICVNAQTNVYEIEFIQSETSSKSTFISSPFQCSGMFSFKL